MKTCYLAGHITGLTYKGCITWRDYATERLADLGITAISPLRGKAHLAEKPVILDTYADHVMTTPQAIVTRDRFDVMQQSDVLLADLTAADSISIGTLIELGWADAARIPIVLVMDAGNAHDHAMVRTLAGYIVEDLEDGIDIVGSILSLEG